MLRWGHHSPFALPRNDENARESRRRDPLLNVDTSHRSGESSDPSIDESSVRRRETLHNVPREACKSRGTSSWDPAPTEKSDTDATTQDRFLLRSLARAARLSLQKRTPAFSRDGRSRRA